MADIYFPDSNIINIHVLRSIIFKSIEYVVTNIVKCNDHLYFAHSITFSDDSEIKCIDISSINTQEKICITIPSGVEKIIQGRNYKHTDIIISPTNNNFKWLEDKLLLGKSNVNSDDFDVIAYARQKITELTIPSNVKHIFPFCFSENQNLRSVVFSDNSELRSIGDSAFYSTSTETIKIPPHVTEIGEYAFSNCKNLRNVIFADNSELRSIGNGAFSSISIQTITIPLHVTEISDDTFQFCYNLRNIEFYDDSELQLINMGAFPTEYFTNFLVLCFDSFDW